MMAILSSAVILKTRPLADPFLSVFERREYFAIFILA
jgi:hypothetical protein